MSCNEPERTLISYSYFRMVICPVSTLHRNLASNSWKIAESDKIIGICIEINYKDFWIINPMILCFMRLVLLFLICIKKFLSRHLVTTKYSEEHLFWKGSAKDASGTDNCTNSSSNDVSFISDFFEEINPNYTAEHRGSCCQYWKGHVFTEDLVGIEPTKERNTPCDTSASSWQDSSLKKLRWILKLR